MKKDCVFCKMSRGEIPVEKIYENDNFFSILDMNQEVKGHCLVISKKHFVTSLDLPVVLGNELLDCLKNTALKIIDKEKAEGFNILNNNFKAGGQEVGHLHFHIFPRKKEDGFRVWY